MGARCALAGGLLRLCLPLGRQCRLTAVSGLDKRAVGDGLALWRYVPRQRLVDYLAKPVVKATGSGGPSCGRGVCMRGQVVQDPVVDRPGDSVRCVHRTATGDPMCGLRIRMQFACNCLAALVGWSGRRQDTRTGMTVEP